MQLKLRLRADFLISLLTKGTSTPWNIVVDAVENSDVKCVDLAFEYAAFTTDDVSTAKVYYLLGGNDPAKCPYGHKVNSYKEDIVLKGDASQMFNESQEQPDVFDDQDPDGL